MTIIVACGLKREAAIIGRPGREVLVVAGGGDCVRLEAELDAMAERAPGWILSSGVAGALDRSLRPGDVVIDGDRAVLGRLKTILPSARVGAIIGQDIVAASPAQKRALHQAGGAIAVDMESHVAKRVAARHSLPFAALRVISDAAEEELPPASLVGMRPDGGIALRAILASLIRQPAQILALIRTGHHAGRAFRSLGRAHDMLARAGIDRLDLRELLLEM